MFSKYCRSEEQYLGRYIRDYLQGNFVVDVHPPLGKMLFSLVAYLLGYDGKFDFMPGKYDPNQYLPLYKQVAPWFTVDSSADLSPTPFYMCSGCILAMSPS